MSMHTASDFNALYASPDPWRIQRARFRDSALRRWVSPLVAGQNVLELGCGEGHLTEAVLAPARSIVGVDISDIAIDRAKASKIHNAEFFATDFLGFPFEGYDVIVAIECVYYLSPEDRTKFFEKVASEHRGKLFILSAPIIGSGEHQRYFTHEEVLTTLSLHGIRLRGWHNLTVRWDSVPKRTLARILKVIPQGHRVLDYLPAALVYQRCYIAIA